MTSDACKTAVQSWAYEVLNPAPITGTPKRVIWDNQNAPRPSPPYLALVYIGETERGEPWYSKVDLVTGQQIYQQIEMELEFQGFGETAKEWLDRIIAAFKQPTQFEKLRALGCSVRSITKVKDISAVVGSTPEARWSFDFVVGFVDIITDSPGYIETAEITNTVTE